MLTGMFLLFQCACAQPSAHHDVYLLDQLYTQYRAPDIFPLVGGMSGIEDSYGTLDMRAVHTRGVRVIANMFFEDETSDQYAFWVEDVWMQGATLRGQLHHPTTLVEAEMFFDDDFAFAELVLRIAPVSAGDPYVVDQIWIWPDEDAIQLSHH